MRLTVSERTPGVITVSLPANSSFHLNVSSNVGNVTGLVHGQVANQGTMVQSGRPKRVVVAEKRRTRTAVGPPTQTSGL